MFVQQIKGGDGANGTDGSPGQPGAPGAVGRKVGLPDKIAATM